MVKIFIDSDDFLDILLNREKFVKDSAKVLDTVERGSVTGVEGWTSPVVLANLSFICRKYIGKERTAALIERLCSLLSISPMGKDQVDFAIKHLTGDFEDALQFASAREAGCTSLVTRNGKDYRDFKIDSFDPEVMSPVDFNAWSGGAGEGA